MLELNALLHEKNQSHLDEILNTIYREGAVSKIQKEMSPIGKILDDPMILETAEPGDEIILYCDTG